MKVIPFEGNSPSCNFEYFRVREGPNYFVSFYKNSSRLIYDPKDCWRVLGVAKFTDSGKALKEWCLSMDEQYGTPQSDTDAIKEFRGSGRKDTSFASEALDESDPNHNTKTII